MRYFIIAGEASGDLHGSGLVRELQAVDPDATIQAWGGERMRDAGAEILKDYRELAFMGFIEVAQNIFTILKNFRVVKDQIKSFKPDALILIDYPGFNLRMAKWAHENNIPVHYYISPQLWAWKEGRVEQVRQFVDRMYVILPFENDFYATHNIEVEFVGHPLIEAVDRYRETNEHQGAKRSGIALLAGSRKQEISKLLPIMLRVAEAYPDEKFTIAAAPNQPESLYRSFLKKFTADNVEIIHGDTYGVLDRSHAALTTSGTATLETALFNVPQVVCYRGSRLSFAIAKRLVKVPYISLVNLIAGKPVVEELIQDNVNVRKVSRALEAILRGSVRKQILQDYTVLRRLLDAGGASNKVATAIYESVKS